MNKTCFALVLAAGMACLGDVSAARPTEPGERPTTPEAISCMAFNVEIDTRFVETSRAALEAVGYFDTNRVDAAVLQERLMARQDAKLLESVRVVTRSGEEALAKHVKEILYPTDYDVQLSHNAASATNAAALLSATVEPLMLTMREVGSIVLATPNVTPEADLIDLALAVKLVGEPEWKDYGAKAKWKGAATYDLPMEQPVFPVRASVDTSVSVRPGRTLVFGGVTDSRRANEDKFVLVFVTVRLVDSAGNESVPPSRRVSCEPKQLEFDVRYVSADRKTLSEVGYFSANRVNAAVLQNRLMAHGGARLLESPRLVARRGEETVLKGVLEYISPNDYDVKHAVSSQAVGTNTVNGTDSAGVAVEPQTFSMRETGTTVDIASSLTDDGDLINIALNTQLVGEPEWKDYGAKAKWKGAETYDLPMEQPFFPVRASTDTKISMRPGATYVFGGGADRRKGDEDKFVFIFVTPRLIYP